MGERAAPVEYSNPGSPFTPRERSEAVTEQRAARSGNAAIRERGHQMNRRPGPAAVGDVDVERSRGSEGRSARRRRRPDSSRAMIRRRQRPGASQQGGGGRWRRREQQRARRSETIGQDPGHPKRSIEYSAPQLGADVLLADRTTSARLCSGSRTIEPLTAGPASADPATVSRSAAGRSRGRRCRQRESSRQRSASTWVIGTRYRRWLSLIRIPSCRLNRRGARRTTSWKDGAMAQPFAAASAEKAAGGRTG